MIALPILVIFLIGQRYFTHGLMQGAIKGSGRGKRRGRGNVRVGPFLTSCRTILRPIVQGPVE
jgi:hypothetical protein